MLSAVISKVHQSSMSRLAGFVGVTLLSLLSLTGCAFNDLFVIPSEAKQQQAADPIDPRQNGDVPQEIVVRNTNGHKLTGWLFSAPGDRGTVLVAGGSANAAILSSAELYNPATGVWTATGSMTTARWYHTATLLPNEQVLVASGLATTGSLASAELYKSATGMVDIQ